MSLVSIGALMFVCFIVFVGYVFLKPSPRAEVSPTPVSEPVATSNLFGKRGAFAVSDTYVPATHYESDDERRRRLGLPKPFETVLSRPFPATTTHQIYNPGFQSMENDGWDMYVSEMPNKIPSTRKTGFILNQDRVVVTLEGRVKLLCINAASLIEKRLVDCYELGEEKNGLFYSQLEKEWYAEKKPVGTKVEMYAILPCNKNLIDAKEPCDL